MATRGAASTQSEFPVSRQATNALSVEVASLQTLPQSRALPCQNLPYS